MEEPERFVNLTRLGFQKERQCLQQSFHCINRQIKFLFLERQKISFFILSFILGMF